MKTQIVGDFSINSIFPKKECETIENLFFEESRLLELKSLENIVNKYSTYKTSSLLIEDEQDFFNYLTQFQSILNNHYNKAQHSSLGNKFPKNCCGISSNNIYFELITEGFLSSIFSYDNQDDHAFISIPFKLLNKDKYGTIILDPTSNQFEWESQIEDPKNFIGVYFSSDWDYIINSKTKKYFYPTVYHNLESDFHNITRKRPNKLIENSDLDCFISDFYSLIEKAWENPQKPNLKIQKNIQNNIQNN